MFHGDHNTPGPLFPASGARLGGGGALILNEDKSVGYYID